MLPRPDRLGIAQGEGLAPGGRADEVGNQAIDRPVAAADDIAGAGAGQANAPVREKPLGVSGGDQFLARLGGAVGIVAAERIVFAEGRAAPVVGVDLVAGDHDDGLERRACSQGFEQIRRAHDIGGEGRPRIGVGGAHQGLGGEMKDDFRVGTGDRRHGHGGVAEIADDRGQARGR